MAGPHCVRRVRPSITRSNWDFLLEMVVLEDPLACVYPGLSVLTAQGKVLLLSTFNTMP